MKKESKCPPIRKAEAVAQTPDTPSRMQLPFPATFVDLRYWITTLVSSPSSASSYESASVIKDLPVTHTFGIEFWNVGLPHSSMHYGTQARARISGHSSPPGLTSSITNGNILYYIDILGVYNLQSVHGIDIEENSLPGLGPWKVERTWVQWMVIVNLLHHHPLTLSPAPTLLQDTMPDNLKSNSDIYWQFLMMMMTIMMLRMLAHNAATHVHRSFSKNGQKPSQKVFCGAQWLVDSLQLQQVLARPRKTAALHWRQRGDGLLSLINMKPDHPPKPFDTLVTGMLPISSQSLNGDNSASRWAREVPKKGKIIRI